MHKDHFRDQSLFHFNNITFCKSKRYAPAVATILLLLNLLCAMPFYAQKSMADIPYPADTKYADLPDGIRMAYTDAGKGEYTLVMIHGLGSNLKAWGKNIEALSRNYRCIALDLPGYGRSSKGDYACTMHFFADHLRDFIRQLRLQKVVLVGHSMGAQVAMTALLQDSTLAERLILLAPAGIETFTEQEKAWFSIVYTPALLKATPPEQIRKNFEANFVQFPADAEFMIQDRMTMRETPEYDAYCTMIPKCVNGMLQEPVYERLPGIKTHTLMLFGANDALIPNRYLHKTLTTRAVAEDGRQRLPNCQLEMIPDSGHFVQWEGAVAVNAAIARFLKQ